MTEEQLSALLRLKRYEQPPAFYFDRLLEDVHRRQRADLLRLPLWKIALERAQTFFSEHSMSHVSYAGALASVLVLGVGTIGLMTPGGSIERVDSPSILAGQTPPASAGRLVSLQPSQGPALDAPAWQTAPSAFDSAVSQPRYIIDARPVSYEQPSSF